MLTAWRSFVRRLRTVLEMIKFEHSVFALPFALTGALLAIDGSGLEGRDLWVKIFWIVVAMIAARSAAMAFNRVIDSDIDAANPRTQMRAIPAGDVTKRFTWGFIIAWSAMFFVAAYRLNPLCLKLAPFALAVLFGYSYTKRYTMLSHLILGFSLGMAPAAAWIAIRGSLDPGILLLTGAVMFWTAGFDIIYACQDYEFDLEYGLKSIPRMLGLRKALLIARLLHIAMVALLIWLAAWMELGPVSLAGVAIVALLLGYEHSLVSPSDLTRVNSAFFTVNGFVSVLFCLFWGADILWL